MKFILPFLFFTTPLLAQVCTESTLTSSLYPLNCDSLEINSPVDLRNITVPIRINVSGNVIINSTINISGQNGGLLTSDGNGGQGGPGAFNGGGIELFEAAPGKDVPHGGARGERDFSVNCGDGAAGGGFVLAGNNGTPCLNSTNPPSTGGVVYDLTNIETILSGGHGGGAGGIFEINPTVSAASGGGGGGALHLTAIGNIQLTSRAFISANGGNGANSINSNGGGGGGSGGVIILEGNTLDLQGKLFARGGKGGQAPNGGHGGDGSSGLIRLKDSNGVVDYIGEKDFTPEKKPDSQELKLNSSISCGTIDSNNDGNGGNLLFQVLLPLFFLIAMTHFKKKFQDLV